jgi:hypothetical protein
MGAVTQGRAKVRAMPPLALLGNQPASNSSLSVTSTDRKGDPGLG